MLNIKFGSDAQTGYFTFANDAKTEKVQILCSYKHKSIGIVMNALKSAKFVLQAENQRYY